MKLYLLKSAAVLILLLTIACGSKPVHQYEMFGYNEGKKQMKYSVTVWPAKSDGGEAGYRIETHINYAIGIKDRRETITTVMTTDALIFRSSEATRSFQGQETVSSLKREGDEMVLTSGGGEETDSKTRVSVTGDLFHIHPLLYSADLTKPGAEKRYPVFHEASKSVKNILIRFAGLANIDLDGKKISAKRFQIEEASAPGTFSDYFLNEKNVPVYIKVGAFEFKPAQ